MEKVPTSTQNPLNPGMGSSIPSPKSVQKEEEKSPIEIHKEIDEILANPPELDWKDSYKSKLWSSAVQKCFEAPFVEVAIQHLLQTIDTKHQQELDRISASVREETLKEISHANYVTLCRSLHIDGITIRPIDVLDSRSRETLIHALTQLFPDEKQQDLFALQKLSALTPNE